jgi:hypothetical protein
MKRIFVACLLLIPALPASGQRVTSPYRFLEHVQGAGAYVGYLNTSEGLLEAGPKSAPTFGVHWGYAISGPVRLTAEAGLTPTTRTVRDTVFLAADSLFREIGEADMLLLSVLANVRLDLTGQRTWNGLQPFILTGAGAVIDLSGSDEIEEPLASTARFDFGTSFAGQIGGGVEWYPNTRFSMRADARSVLWKLDVPEAFQLTAAGRNIVESRWEMNVLLALGFSIHF